MSNNIFNSNDDDIFEEYVDSPSTQNQSSIEDKNTFDKVFSDVDSPFKTLLQNSSLKVNFSEAFYQAAHEWIMRGYQQANTNSIIEEVVRLTDGQFLYRHRLTCSIETLSRKKTIIKFLSMLLEEDSSNLVARAEEFGDLNIHLSETYFNMFFRSFYNIHLHTFYHEVALYKALCDVLNIEHNQELCDHTIAPDQIIDTADYINSLYIQYFDKDFLQEKIDKYVKELFNTQD